MTQASEQELGDTRRAPWEPADPNGSRGRGLTLVLLAQPAFGALQKCLRSFSKAAPHFQQNPLLNEPKEGKAEGL